MPRYFTKFDEYNFFPQSLIFISSRSTFLGDLKFTSSVFPTLIEILFVSYHGWLAYLVFLQTYLYERDLYHKQSDALCSNELPYRDH